MTTPHALVSGASVAGLCTAFWLDRIGWRVSVVERADSFRDGGQNVDVRGVAREVLALMGLERQVRALTTTEQGTSVVDDRGRVIAAFPVQEEDGPTAELEILRGDLARTVLDALPPRVEVRYGDHLEHAGPDGAVTFASGATGAYDLVVVAEGVRSRTRDRVFGDLVRRQPLGLNMAYGTIDRTDDDDRWWRWYVMDGGRQVTLRPDAVGTTRATLAFTSDRDDLAALGQQPALAELARVFAGGGWQTRRVVDGFAASDDVYVDYLTQVVVPTWARGRVCLTGDAAWCVTPLGGGGTSLAMTGAYVLAACLSETHDADDPEPGDAPDAMITRSDAGLVATALAAYERWMRPLVEEAQKLPPGTPGLFYPRTRAGVTVWRSVAALAGTRPMRKVTGRLGHVARTDRPLPPLRSTDRGGR